MTLSVDELQTTRAAVRAKSEAHPMIITQSTGKRVDRAEILHTRACPAARFQNIAAMWEHTAKCRLIVKRAFGTFTVIVGTSKRSSCGLGPWELRARAQTPCLMCGDSHYLPQSVHCNCMCGNRVRPRNLQGLRKPRRWKWIPSQAPLLQ